MKNLDAYMSLTKALKDKITVEAQNLNYIPKTGQLPV